MKTASRATTATRLTFYVLANFLVAGPLAFSQSPTPATSPVAADVSASSSPVKSDTPDKSAPAVVANTKPLPSRQAVDSLSDGDTHQAIELLKSNYLDAASVSDEALNRATLLGLLERLGSGATIQQSAKGKIEASPFRSEILDDRVGYIRVGSLSKESLSGFDTALENFSGKGLGLLVLDLRATPASSDFELASEFLKRLTPKGKVLFTVRHPSSKQEQIYTSNQDPAFHGVLVTLVNQDTAGAAEVIAATLRVLDNALAVGKTTAGQAAEFTDLPLQGGKVLRVAVGEVKLPNNIVIFPSGLKPDLTVDVSEKDEAEALKVGLKKGVSGLVFQPDRIRLNEAALVAGVNPELDEVEAEQNGGPKQDTPIADASLQRAVDMLTTIQIFGKQKAK